MSGRRRSGERRSSALGSGDDAHSGDDTGQAEPNGDVGTTEGTEPNGDERSQRTARSRDDHRPPAAIECEELTKSYGEVDALFEVDLEVRPGQAVVLVGHNGSGKSTLLNLVAGTLEATDGYVAVNGNEPDSIPARAERSWLPDNPVLYDDLTVEEHLWYISRLHDPGGTRSDRGGDAEARNEELIERLGLSERRSDLPSQFSRGLRQKTAIAVALCRPFSVLLVDEPFVGLDASGRRTMLELLAEANDDGATVLVATHDPDVIERFERGLMMSNGELVHDGAADDLPGLLAAD
ncbi:MAG: ABC transporter ATP-binding protein [Microthrixaceae bacterium]